MKFTHIQSKDLPNVDPYVKECVNSGQWFLFKSPNKETEASYFLKVGKEIYGLDESGKILLSITPEELTMEELFYFDDVPRPVSLSNQFSMSL
ncbi:hypothetical protein [Vibrio nitrifigilis]|uniref:Uncharacterized protein n=1 Tax=Vibrio nitrifigilis TaxID=2789781 RepID=A0ABS0GHV0_9VIBR|nr:hypothetical protein [Vibrio nitrifigilis]MBF9002006.1 hypothetical protein [Vibrio nitrifigilis]